MGENTAAVCFHNVENCLILNLSKHSCTKSHDYPKKAELSFCIQARHVIVTGKLRSQNAAEACKHQSKWLRHRWGSVLCPLTQAPWTSALPTSHQCLPLKIWTFAQNIPFLRLKFLFSLTTFCFETLSFSYEVSRWYSEISSWPWQGLGEGPAMTPLLPVIANCPEMDYESTLLTLSSIWDLNLSFTSTINWCMARLFAYLHVYFFFSCMEKTWRVRTRGVKEQKKPLAAEQRQCPRPRTTSPQQLRGHP